MEPIRPYGSQPFGQSTMSNFSQQSFSRDLGSPIPSPEPKARPSFAPKPSNLSRENREFLKPSNFFSVPDNPYSDEEEGGGQDKNAADDGIYDEPPPIDERYSEDEDDRMTQDAPYEYDGGSMTGYMSGAKGYGQSTTSNLLFSTMSSPRRSVRNGSPGSIGRSPVGKAENTTYGRIARDSFANLEGHSIEESGDLILRTEQLVMRLYDEGLVANDDDQKLEEALSTIPTEIVALWAEYDGMTSTTATEEYISGIGPNPKASDFSKANFIASLLLQLHHPYVAPTSTSKDLFFARSLRSSVMPTSSFKETPVPQILLEWMSDYHYPYPDQMVEVLAYKPSPSSHPNFWDVIYSELLRGKVIGVANALRDAGWKHAKLQEEDEPDSSGLDGYRGAALTTVEKVVNEAVQLLDQCPAARGDWNVQNSDWTLFRLRASQAAENLKRFAEGRDKDSQQLSSFDGGISTRSALGQSYTGTARVAQSRVPWGLYQNLLAIYGLLEGSEAEIVACAEDWCEAAIGLLVWWDEGRDDRRIALGQSHAGLAEFSDKMGSKFYIEKLARCFRKATEGTDIQVNTLVPTEVALACAFQGDIEAVILCLRSLSGPISSAVVEIASLGSWLPTSESQNLISMGGLDQDDMAVLGLASPSDKADGLKDSTLISYASALAEHGKLETEAARGRSKASREGWEVAIEILGRLDSSTRSEEEVTNVLQGLPQNDGATVNKLIRLLNDLGMANLAENVSEVSI
jgi:hypothetical protein